jgi:signal transduction histidine kinase
VDGSVGYRNDVSGAYFASASGADEAPIKETDPVIVLLDTDGTILATNAPWRESMSLRSRAGPIGEVGHDYVDAVTGFFYGIDAPWLREQIAALAARKTDEVRAEMSDAGDAAGPRQLRITRLDHDERPVLVATHIDLSGVAETQEALHALQDQLATARSAERQRFAGSLAEVTSAHLEALRRDLSVLRAFVDDAAAQGMIARMEASLQEAMHETRNFADLMHPAALDGGLAAASRRLARDFADDAGLGLRYRTSGPVDRAPRAVQEAAFRVLQAALSNVHRHAEANSVAVTLSVRDGALRIRIADDGRGLPPGPLSPGVGISGMRDRAAALGGAVEVINGRRGAIVLARLPFGAATDP